MTDTIAQLIRSFPTLVIDERPQGNKSPLDEEHSDDDRVLEILPDPWVRGGNQPGYYTMGLDERVKRYGTASAFIRSNFVFSPEIENPFGTVCQNFFPQKYFDQVVRITAHLRFELDTPRSWTGIFVKVDYVSGGIRDQLLDNMFDRRLQGSSNGEWVHCELVHPVPSTATNFTFGFLLCGEGTVWASDFNIDIVDDPHEMRKIPDFFRSNSLSISNSSSPSTSQSSTPSSTPQCSPRNSFAKAGMQKRVQNIKLNPSPSLRMKPRRVSNHRSRSSPNPTQNRKVVVHQPTIPTYHTKKVTTIGCCTNVITNNPNFNG
eukprot:TRINITY_DN3113_c0_g1_i1.p1 TRINITY_DN3113_c0_g1~~TRINITY_DN3113_c0_g1_i1.p1  ORF type:complete len:318 (-),score=60.86 TRINITY_DN3113_c0_g1_i1:58-1011(-)